MKDERETLPLSEDFALGKSEGTDLCAAPASLEVFLAPTRTAHMRGPLGWLARLYGLDVYGGSQLGRQASLALQASALLLVVIVSFDLMAWILLFNSIFHANGDIRDVDLFWTPLAVFLGVLFAAAVFLYERQFLTADTSEIFTSLWKFLSVTLAVGLRLGILVVAALITAQPIELLIFREPIRERVLNEQIRNEIVAKKLEIEEFERNLKTLPRATTSLDQIMRGTREAEDLDEIIRDLKEARDLRTRTDCRSQENWDRCRILHRRIWTLETNQKVAESKFEAERDKRKRETGQAVVEALTADLHRHIDILRNDGLEERAEAARPVELPEALKPLVPKGLQAFPDHFRGTHFFDQLRVLQDYLEGRPPRWPARVSAKRRSELASEFALDDLSTDQQRKMLAAVRLCPFFPWASDRPMETDLEVERRVAEACLLRRSYGVAYAIAMVIPLLVLAIKFLIPRELKHYFSLRQQAWAGNPEALSALRGAQRMREERQQVHDGRGASYRWGLPSGRTAPDA